jgi:hypothetical protein
MIENIATLLTTVETAEYLGVTVERILYWASDGLLRVAAQTEAGDLLFRQHVLDTVGEDLTALAPVRRPRHRRTMERERLRTPLPCGCCPSRSAFKLCRTGAGLLAALQLAEGFAAAAPNDRLLAKLAGLCRDALTQHLAPPATVKAGLDPYQVSYAENARPNPGEPQRLLPPAMKSDTPAPMTAA